MRVVFMGTPQFAVAPLEHLIASHYQVVGVCTQPDRAAGRGRSPAASPVKVAALAHGLPVMQPSRLKGAAVARLADMRPEVIVVAAFGQLLPGPVLELPAHGCLNVHPSLLPKYRGAAPVPAAILNGDSFTGVSIMQMDAGLDTGPVLGRAQIPIFPWDTTGSLMDKLSLVGAQLLLELLPRLARGETPEPQDEAQATYSGRIRKEDGRIDWRLPAVDIWRRVRAFQPWPGCYTVWRGRQLKVLEAVPASKEGACQPGRVVALDRGCAAFGVGTGDGVLGVVRVQLEGKRAMSAAEFLRGQRDFLGSLLESA